MFNFRKRIKIEDLDIEVETPYEEEKTPQQRRVETIGHEGFVSQGKRSAKKNKALYGEDFYKVVGRKGGLKSRGGGFSGDTDRAREAGAKGGKNRWKGKD